MPKAASASRCAVLKARSNSCDEATTRMPRPPPPAVALTITGYPRPLAALSARSTPSSPPSVPGSTGTPALFIARRARRLVAHQSNDGGRRTDERDLARLTRLRQIDTLGQEAVSGMQRIGTRDLGGTDHRRHVEVAVDAPGRPDTHVFVGEADVQRTLIRLRIDGDRADPELAARIDDAKRDFPTICDQDLLEHGSHGRQDQRSCRLKSGARRGPSTSTFDCILVPKVSYPVLIANSRSPYCTGCPLSTNTFTISPPCSESISFINFIASMMHRT